jgi:hypothetical protein
MNAMAKHGILAAGVVFAAATLSSCSNLAWSDLTKEKAHALVLEAVSTDPCDRFSLYETNRATFIRNPMTPLDMEHEKVGEVIASLVQSGYQSSFERGRRGSTEVLQTTFWPKDRKSPNDAVSFEADDNSWLRYTPRVYGCRSVTKSVDILDITLDPNNPKRADVVYRLNRQLPPTVVVVYEKIKSLSSARQPEEPQPVQGTLTLQRLDAMGWRVAL